MKDKAVPGVQVFDSQKVGWRALLILGNKLQVSTSGFLLAVSKITGLINCRSTEASEAAVITFAIRQ